MNTAKILKHVPTMIMIVGLAFACYKIHATVPDAGAGRTELVKGLDVMMNDVLHSGAEEVRALARDPFRTGPKPIDATKAAEAAPADPVTDPLYDFVHSLSLGATFLQGKTQIAIINGRMYKQGEHLILERDGEKLTSSLFIEKVQAQRVTLRARDTKYELAYPDQLGSRPADVRPASGSPRDGSIGEIDPEGEIAFFKKLLNSPLGKLGKGLTGNPGLGQPASGAGRSRAQGRRQGGVGAGAP
jgi:hypothetical protein